MKSKHFSKYFLLILILLGLLFTWWVLERTEKDIREDLIRESQMLAQSINIDYLKVLIEKDVDTNLIEYKRIKEQLKNVVLSQNRYRFISLIGSKDLKNYFIIADSENENSIDYSPPGFSLNEFEFINDYNIIFEGKKAVVFGPDETIWGNLITVSAPIIDKNENKTIASLDLDIYARDWILNIFRKSLLPIGMIIVLIISLYSIYNLRQKSIALKQSEEKFRSIFESIEDVYFQTNIVGIIKILSPSIEKLLGWKPEELIGQPVKKLYYNLEDREKLLKEISKNNCLVDYQIALLHKNGTKVYTTESSNYIYNQYHKKIGICGTLRNINERKIFEQKIIKYSEELENTNAQKDKFFSIIAHDLRSPLAGLLNLLHFLNEEFNEIPDNEKHEQLVNIAKSANNIFKLLENLLEWSVIQRGLIEFNPENINLLLFCKNSVEPLREIAYQKNIEIFININEQSELYADSYMMNVVIRNLISNAIKFTPKGGEIRISCSKTEEYCEITIADNGIGIPDYILPNLFKLGEKTNRPGTENEKSTGLGLLLCKEYIDKHNGLIRVESKEMKGSKFIISVPLQNV